MSKKFIIVTIIVLVVALIGGIFWYINQPAPAEEPAEPEGGEIAVNSEPQQDTPEPEQEEPEESAPETPEDDSEEEVPVANKTVEEILAEAGLLEEPTEDDGTAGEIVEGTGEGQGESQDQQQEQGQVQGGGQQSDDETVKALEEILAATGATKGAGKTGKANDNITGGGTINWG